MKNRDLTQGNIVKALLRLSLPIAGGQFMHMAHSLTDMFWLGQSSSHAYAIAATGTAGLFIWLSVGLMLVGRVGAEIGVSQSRGRDNIPDAYLYARTALFLAAGLGILYGTFLFVLRGPLIGLFRFQEANVAAYTITYLGIMAFGIPASFITSSLSGTFNASGNSRTPFVISSCGIVLNMILSPIFILVLDMGVVGAGITSVAAQYTVMIAMAIAVKRFRGRPFEVFKLTARFDFAAIRADIAGGKSRDIFRLTWPVCLENTLFPLLTMATTYFEVAFGAFAVSISRVGTQVESLSWLVGAGFGAALTAFVGQNFGAGKHTRINTGVRYTTIFMLGWGALVACVLWFGSPVIIAAFLPEFAHDPDMVRLVVLNLRILAACQVLSNLEFVATNAFRGKGRTLPPSITGIASNVIRVPLAFLLSRFTPLGLLGVWVAISATAAFRGVSIFAWYHIEKRKAASYKLPE
ncbi:MAG: MATE family efflux transporter [Defluviitaleaceae bacterium]|nr:MATE family efflux transporter [Defluviitaleaceae bacterium]